MNKIKNITATEALRLMRLGFSDAEIIGADTQISEASTTKSAPPEKKKRQSVKKPEQDILSELEKSVKSLVDSVGELEQKAKDL